VNQAQDIDRDETTPALDVEPILAIHRDPGGFVGFVRKPDPAAPPRLDKNGKPYQFETLFAIPVADLREMFPALAGWLTHDSYFTVNAYHMAAPYQNRQTGLPDVWRKEKDLRSLTACYADIDCGRPESEEPGAVLDWRQAQHEAENMADLGLIPYPSIMARSGRGVYLFWLLRDDKDPDKLPHAWPEKVALYKACNRALGARLRAHALPADAKAIDAARVLRVPGSIHRKAHERVGYVIQLNDHGRGFVYTLPELAEFLDLPALGGDLPDGTRALARPAQYRRVLRKGSAPKRSNGTKAMNAKRAQDLLSIRTWRGGFLKRGAKYPDGHTAPGRRFVLMLYANFLHGSGAAEAEALDALRSMAAGMIPAWPDEPGESVEALAAAEYSEKKRRNWSNTKLCSVLGISADVARELDLQTIRPPDVEAEAEAALPLQRDIVQARRAFARKYIEAHGGISARRLANVYQAKGYTGANQQTANQDLLSILGPDRYHKGGRPRKAAL
jgi:hypothetical protein